MKEQTLNEHIDRIVDSETANIVNFVCKLAKIGQAGEMSDVETAVKTAVRLSIYRAAILIQHYCYDHERKSTSN